MSATRELLPAKLFDTAPSADGPAVERLETMGWRIAPVAPRLGLATAGASALLTADGPAGLAVLAPALARRQADWAVLRDGRVWWLLHAEGGFLAAEPLAVAQRHVLTPAALAPGGPLEHELRATQARLDQQLADPSADLDPWRLGRRHELRLASAARSGQRGPRRRGGGAFYTPRPIVEALVDRALDGFEPAYVLDPACGAGAFLLATGERLAARLCGGQRGQAWTALGRARETICGRRLFGLDCDAGAAGVAAAALERWAGAACPNLGRGDALLGDALERLMPAGGMDLIVGNPPFLSVKRGELAARREALRDRYALARGQWDAYMLFVERAVALLRPGGRLAFVLPRPALVNEHAEPMRRMLATAGSLREVIDLGRAFPGAEVETAGIVFERGHTVRRVRISAWQRDRVTGHGEIPADWQARRPGAALPVGLRPADVALLDRIEAAPLRLGDLVDLRRGLEIGKRDAAVRVARPRAGRPLLRGQDVGAFRARPEAWIDLDGLAARGARPELFDRRPKLVVRRVASRPVAAVDGSGAWCLNTLYVALPLATVDLDWLALVLNSSVASFWFHASCGGDEALFPYLRQSQLRVLPLPPPDLGLAALARRVAAAPTAANRAEADLAVAAAFGLEPDEAALLPAGAV